MKKSLLLLLALCAPLAFGEGHNSQSTFAIRPGQKYTVYNIPPGASIHVSAGLPVNLYFANCHVDQIIDSDVTCDSQGERLVIIDSRPRSIFGQNNEVRVTLAY